MYFVGSSHCNDSFRLNSFFNYDVIDNGKSEIQLRYALLGTKSMIKLQKNVKLSFHFGQTTATNILVVF